MTTALETLSPDVRRFVEREDLSDALEGALALVAEQFPDARRVKLETITDPEDGNTWISIVVQIVGSVDDALAGYHRSAKRWVADTPWPAVNLISLTVDVV